MKRMISATSLAAAILITLLGCASPDDDSATTMTFEEVLAAAQDEGGDEQVQILSDGEVTTTEFRHALDNYFACLEESGLTYIDNGPNPVDGWRPLTEIGWSGISNSEGPARDADCSRANLDYVMLGYEILNEDIMDPALMSSVQSCLQIDGVEVTGDERNVDDLLPLGHDDESRASAVEGCIFRESATYPYGVILAY